MPSGSTRFSGRTSSARNSSASTPTTPLAPAGRHSGAAATHRSRSHRRTRTFARRLLVAASSLAGTLTPAPPQAADGASGPLHRRPLAASRSARCSTSCWTSWRNRPYRCRYLLVSRSHVIGILMLNDADFSPRITHRAARRGGFTGPVHVIGLHPILPPQLDRRGGLRLALHALLDAR